MKVITLIFLLLSSLFSKEPIVFGTISTVDSHLMEKKLAPLIAYLEEKTDRKIIFETGYNYQDTINKFSDGTFDIGFIGPVPYFKVQEKKPDVLLALGRLENSDENTFTSVIVSKKGSHIVSLEDLRGTSFAFGSPNSTLSYYVPMSILMQSNTLQTLKEYSFLGAHDKVAQYVIMGKFDAGAVKKSVANKYAKYLQGVTTSIPYPDFLIVANKNMDKKLIQEFKKAILELKDLEVLRAIKSSAIGFKETEDSHYGELKALMLHVDKKL